MDVKLLFLTVVLSSPLLTLCDPLFVLSAPNLLRVGSSENVFVEAQDYSGGDLNVRIIVKKFPLKNMEILSKSVTLTAANNFQILTDIKIPDDQSNFSDDPLEKQYVYLQAQFPSVTLEKVVMLSFQTGYILAQTDKPIYTPASTVLYMIFSLTPNMKPLIQSGITVEIMAKTKDPQLREDQQAVKKMTAQAYETKGGSKNYLHIGIDAAELQIGDQMKVNLITGQSPGFKDQDYTYIVLSKGQIVKVDRFKRRGQSLVSLSLPVTKDMVPSFRFVAYYHVGSSEVVSDSVWVAVKDTYMGKLQLEVKNKMNSYSTGDEVELQITGDPGAKVGLVVVDKAVNILNKNRLTQTEIWDVIEQHDTGCTAGGGRDSMGVFTDAGLMFESNTAGGTSTRAPECHFLSKRRRRSLGEKQQF